MLVELKQKKTEALDAADRILAAAERNRRPLTQAEGEMLNSRMREADRLSAEIARQTEQTAGGKRAQLDALLAESRKLGPTLNTNTGLTKEPLAPRKFSAAYQQAFYKNLASGGRNVSDDRLSEGISPAASGWLVPYRRRVSAALYESSNAAGGYAVPSVVEPEIVPLAPADSTVRRLATVIETQSDRHIPTKSSFGGAALKTEASTGFSTTVPALNTVLLSAFSVGTFAQASMEIIQDVSEFEAFVLDDIGLDILQLEEPLWLTGSGSGEPQGMIGNVGSGVTEAPDGLGNLVSLDGISNLIGSLKAAYLPNATFLMSRATGIVVRKAQVQTNYFRHVWTRENGQDFLEGFPVAFSDSMPSAARGNAPILFGNFRMAYVIGDRGTSAVRLVVIDQAALASAGVIGLIGYRRTDGRIRRAEAVQQYNIAAS